MGGGLRSGSFVLEFVFLLCKKIKLLTYLCFCCCRCLMLGAGTSLRIGPIHLQKQRNYWTALSPHKQIKNKNYKSFFIYIYKQHNKHKKGYTPQRIFSPTLRSVCLRNRCYWVIVNFVQWMRALSFMLMLRLCLVVWFQVCLARNGWDKVKNVTKSDFYGIVKLFTWRHSFVVCCCTCVGAEFLWFVL